MSDQGNFSTVITSKNRKVQIGFESPDNQNERVLSASQATTRSARPPSSSQSSRVRPATHDGFTPLPPESPKRTFKSVSPRQISLKVNDDGEFPGPNPVKNNYFSTPLEKALEFTDDIRSSTTAANESIGIADTLDDPTPPCSTQAVIYEFKKYNVDNMIPSFVRSGTRGENRNKDLKDQPSTETSITTRYPSLGHRLRVSMNVDHAFQYPQAVQGLIFHDYNNAGGGRTTSPSKKREKKSSDFFNRLYSTSKVKRQKSFTITANPQNDELSTDSDIFDAMTIEGMIQYVVNYDSKDHHPDYVHVTPRYNIEKVRVTNFYDLVLLEQPGHPKSGYVWTRDHKKYRVHSHDVLRKDQIMQLSMNGLLVPSDDRQSSGELISIQQLLVEREQFHFLRTGRFFGMFKELKAFHAWKYYTQHSYVQRMKRKLVKDSYFSDPELVECILLVINTTYDLELNTELFHFSGNGTICVSDYFSTQMKKIMGAAALIQQKVEELGNQIVENYNNFMNSTKLQDLIQDVKDHHPLKEFMKETNYGFNTTMNLNQTVDTGINEEKIDWVKFRSMQRLGDNFKQKIANILFVAQFRIEYNIACIIEKFWLRLKQFLLGVYGLGLARRRGDYWELNKGLFDSQGNLVLDESNDPFMSLVPNSALGIKSEEGPIIGDEEESEINVPMKNLPIEISVGSGPHGERLVSGARALENDDDDHKLQAKIALFERQNRHMFYQRIVKEVHPSQKISLEWEKQGSHLSVLVNLHFVDTLKKLEIEDLLNLGNHNIDKVKVLITPSKTDIMNEMHLLCGTLGTLMELLPNLKFHPLICSEETKYLYKRKLMYGQNRFGSTFEPEVSDANSTASEEQGFVGVVASLRKGDAEEENGNHNDNKQKSSNAPTRHDNHQSSSNYFTFLIMSPVFNSRNNYQLAIDTIKYLHQAYLQASNVDSYRIKLLEIVRKLWSLSPNLLVKQLERALALSKIREYVENPDVVEDLNRSQDRDKGRLQSYRSAIDYVEKLAESTLVNFMNLKHSMGLVTSFRPVLLQIYAYKMIQDFHLHNKLSSSFVTRCAVVYDFVRALETTFDSNQIPTPPPTHSKGTNGSATQPGFSYTYQQIMFLIQLLHRIKNFDEVKGAFDTELEMNEVLYNVITLYTTRKTELTLHGGVIQRDAGFLQQFDREFTTLEMRLEQLLSRSTSSHHGKRPAARRHQGHGIDSQLQAHLASLPPEKLYKVFNEALERLGGILSKSRSNLLVILHDIKSYVMQNRQELSSQIRYQLDRLKDYQIVLPDYVVHEIRAQRLAERFGRGFSLSASISFKDSNSMKLSSLIGNDSSIDENELQKSIEDLDNDFKHHITKSTVEITQFINAAGREVEKLRKLVDESVGAQHILLEAHDIVGAANAILMQSEVNDYGTMDELEKVYNHRCLVWKVIMDTESIRKQLYSAKLGNPTLIIDLHKQFLETYSLYSTLSTQIFDDNLNSNGDDILAEFDDDGKKIDHTTHSLNIKPSEIENASGDPTLPNSELLIKPMSLIIQDVLPKVETAAYLASKHLKSRHWQYLNHFAFKPVKMVLKFSGRQNEFISVVDVSSTPSAPITSSPGGGIGNSSNVDAVGLGLGNIHRLTTKELFDRHIQTNLEDIRYITSEAMIEAIMEKTLESIEQTLRASSVQLSTLWLRDSRVREKIFNELNEILNLIPLRVMSRYCWKAVTMVETTSQDMSLSTFDYRIERTKDFIFKLDKFLENYREVQYYWFYSLVIIKFIGRNDIDRDMLRVFNNVTEDMKKVEMQFLQKNGNLLSVFAANSHNSIFSNGGNGSNKEDAPEEKNESGPGNSSSNVDVMNTENMKLSLSYILEDIHSIIQSLLDACPRLSLMSYNKLVVFYKAWLFGPQSDPLLISDCLKDMFEGVGKLHFTLLHGQKQFVCDGFDSANGLEFVQFLEPISLAICLEDFVGEFELQIRKSMEKSCDILILHRINCIRALLGDQENSVIVENIKAIFQIRLEHLKALISNEHSNQSYLLINMCSCAEDLWTCLGHPTGCLTMAKPDLLIENGLFMRNWRSSLDVFIEVAKENIENLQEWVMMLSDGSYVGGFNKETKSYAEPLFSKVVSCVKARQLLSNLLVQEVSFLRMAHELHQCSCVESATELWAGKYQLRFEYIKEHRYRHVPLDITLGNIAIPYGFEYFEGGNVMVIPAELEFAIGRVLSSAFSLRGVTFINVPTYSYNREEGNYGNFFNGNEGEYSISGKDIATALGRLCSTLSDATHIPNIRLFFSRLIYLDAVGCIDFTTINQENLQQFIQIAQTFWAAMEHNNDQYIQDSCKYPIKAKFTRNDVQAERRKTNLNRLRADINAKKKGNIYLGFIFIGFASETAFTSLTVFDQFYRSVFDSISIANSKAVDYLGVMLTSKGFHFGIELENVFRQSIMDVLKFTNTNSGNFGEAKACKVENLFHVVLSSREILRLVQNSGLSLFLIPSTRYFANNKNLHGRIGRFYLEILCFCGNLWERILELSVGIVDASTLSKLRVEFFVNILGKLEQIINPDEVEKFKKYFETDALFIRRPIHQLVMKIASKNGYIANHDFVASCVMLWENIMEGSSPLFVLQGESSAGKTAIRETVTKAINSWHYAHKAERLRLIQKRLAKNIGMGAALIEDEGIADLDGQTVIDPHAVSVIARVAAQRVFAALYNWWNVQKKVRDIVSLENSRQQLFRTSATTTPTKGVEEEDSKNMHSMSMSIDASEDSKVKGIDLSGKHQPPVSSSVLPLQQSKPTKISLFSGGGEMKSERQRIKEEQQEEEALNSQLRVTVIFHASLTTNSLIGTFDGQGRWTDGIMLRKLRHIHETTYNQQAKLKNHRLERHLMSNETAESKKAQQLAMLDSNKLHFIVLDGPVSYQVEQMLHGLFFQSFSALTSLTCQTSLYNHLTFPTGEFLALPENLRIVLETSDLANASPTFVALVRCQQLSFSLEDSYKRLLTVWIRSLYGWLGDFPPWLDFLEELNFLLLSSTFVEDLLYEDLHNANTSLGLIVGKVTSFLRILEELLVQVQEMALVSSNFSIYDDKEESSTDSDPEDDNASEEVSVDDNTSDGEDEINKVQAAKKQVTFDEEEALLKKLNKADDKEKVAFKYKGAMSLNAKGRELLLRRGKIAIIFAAVWGFGGAYNSTDKRKFFESMVRDIVQQYLDIPDGDNMKSVSGNKIRNNASIMISLPVTITSDCSIFECILSLEDCAIIPAYQYDPRTKAVVQNQGLPEKYFYEHVYCDLMPKSGHLNNPELLEFHSLNTRAVKSIIHIMLSAGANILLFGVKSSGKTKLLTDVLESLKQRCPTPDDMRAQIMNNLISIINGSAQTEGIFRAMDILRSILQKASSAKQLPEFGEDFNSYWRKVGNELQAMWSGSPRKQCQNQSVSSSSTSIRSFGSAKTLRQWFEREFASETKYVLETSRFTYGLAFIDDLHFMHGSDEAGDVTHRNLDQCDELLRGILYAHEPFAIKRQAVVRSATSLGYHHGSADGLFQRNTDRSSVFHREYQSDMRFALSPAASDDMMLQKIGLVSGATGHCQDFFGESSKAKTSSIRNLVSYFSCVSLPSFSMSEIHVSILTGTLVAISSAEINMTERQGLMIEVFKQEITDLSKMTLHLCQKMISTNDSLITTSMEKILRTCIVPNISLVARFCTALFHGSPQIRNPGGLLELFTHEWKRFFLDPLPEGSTQFERNANLIIEQLDAIEERTWFVSREWVEGLKEQLLSNSSSVWSNEASFASNDWEIGRDKGVVYKPLKLSTSTFNDNSSTIGNDPISIENQFDVFGCLTIGEVKSILYPAAFSYLLRMVRILTVVGKHALLTGYCGSSRSKLVVLAAKICRLTPFLFSPKEVSDGVVENIPSETSQLSSNFKNYLKKVILRAAGFSDPVTAADQDVAGNMFIMSGQVFYGRALATKTMLVIDGAQQMNREDRRLLLNIIDRQDPSLLFEDGEILGMADCLRKMQKEQSIEFHDMSRSARAHKHGFASTTDYSTRVRTNTEGEEINVPQALMKPSFVPSYHTRGGLTGYTFSWIRSFLRFHLVENIHIVLIVDLTRSMEVEINGCYSYFEALKHLRKASGVPPKKSSGPSSSSKTSKSSSGQDLKSSKENNIQNNRTMRSSSKGYSLLSSRNNSSMTQQMFEEFYDPTSDIHELLKSEGYEGVLNAGSDQGIKSGTTTEQKFTSSEHSLFTCGIVGPALARRFYFMWYDLQYCTTVEGIAKSVFHKFNGDLGNKVRISLLSSPVGKYFESQVASTGEPQKAAVAAATIVASSKRVSILEKQANKRQSVRRNTFTKMSGNSSRNLASSNIASAQKIMTTSEREEGEIIRLELNFKSPSMLQAMQSSIASSTASLYLSVDDQLPFDTFALIDKFGIFEAFLFPNSVIADVRNLPSIACQVHQMIREAKDLLSFALTVGLPCDAMFLQQPLYVNGGDRIASHSYQYLVYIIESLGRELLCSKYMYDKILVGYNEAIYALENTDFMDSKLLENNEELIKISRKLSKDVENTRKELENVAIDYTRTMHYEQELMIRDDIISLQLEVDFFEMKLNEVWYQHKKRLLTYKNQAWQSFSIIFTTKPYPKPMIDLMRAIMVIINYTPPKLAKKDDKKDGSFSIKMDDDMVARCSMSLIMKLSDFMNQLQNISPTTLTSVQTNALKIMNSLLNPATSSLFQAELHSPPSRFKLYIKHIMKEEPTQFSVSNAAGSSSTPAPALPTGSDNTEEPSIIPQQQQSATIPSHPLYDVLRKYLILIDLYAVSSEFISNKRAILEDKKKKLEEIRQFNIKEKENICVGLKEQLEQLMNQLNLLDTTIQKNRLKQETIEKSRIRKAELSKGLTSARSFAQSESNKISDTLQVFVHDIVVAITLFFRVGWLPDQIRQESLEIIRQEIDKNFRYPSGAVPSGPSLDDKKVGSPLILGSLLDRLQCRSWMKHSELSLANDVPSLNSISLLYLSPWYTLVVDPDGSALHAILETVPCTLKTNLNETVDPESGESQFEFQEEQLFDCYVIAAQKFSITVFQTWITGIIQATDGTNNSGSDTVNNNLNFGNPHDASDPMSSSLTSGNNGSKILEKKPQKGLFLIVNDVHCGSSDDLICLLSSRIITDQSNEKYLEILPRSNVNSSQSTTLDGQSSYLIRLPNRFRLVLLSSIPPTLASNGESKPLPLSCMQYINTLHWSVNLFSSMYVEKSPIQISVEQNYANDHILTNRLSWNLCKSLSPGNLETLISRNQTLLLESTQLITIEKDVNVMVFEWMQLEHDQTTKSFAIEGLVEQGAISLSILSREDIIQYIIKANPIRDDLQRSLAKELSLIRENMAFQSSFKETFAMTGDFLRMCGQLLPAEVFPPYCLTSNALTNSFFPVVIKFVKKNKGLSKFPISLYHAWKVLKGIISIQRIVRHRQETECLSPSQSSKKQVYRLSSGSGSSSKKYSTRLSGLSPAGENTTSTNPSTGNNPSAATNMNMLIHQEEISRDIGLLPCIRRKALQLMHFKLLPLRTLFLREMVRYVQLHIRPGLESLLKLILILSTWAQSDPIPADEVRALFYMLLEGKGFCMNRFCYYFHVKDIVVKHTNNNHNAVVPAPPSESTSASGFVSRRIRASNNTGPAIGETRKDEQDDEDDLDEDEFDEDERFVDRSPSAMIARKGSSNVAPKGRTSGNKLNTNLRSNSGIGPNLGLEQAASNCRLGATNHRPGYYDLVLERGSGLPDGLWLNKRSRRYTAAMDLSARSEGSSTTSAASLVVSSSPITVSTYATTTTASTRPKFLSLYDYGVHFYADENTYITQRSRLLRLVAKSGDPFEVEWLKCKGLRTFSAFNNQAVIALGASVKAAEDIHRARQTQIKLRSPVGKKNSMIQANSGGKGIGLMGMLGAKGSKILGSMQQTGSSGPGPILSGPPSARKSMIGNKSASQRRKSSIHSMFADGADTSGTAGGGINSMNHKGSRRLTNRASNLLENIASNVRDSRRVVISNTLATKWSRRQSTAISVSHHSSPTDHRLSSIANKPQPSTLTALTGIGIGSEFTEIVYDDRAYVNLLLLESHPSLSIIFKGITAGIQRNILDFVEWKENLVYLESIDSKKLSEKELLSLLQGILPPRCPDVEGNPFGVDSFGSSNIKDAANEEGMWAKGFELTILQSWLLTEALWPGSSANMMEVMYSLVAKYLEKDGYIILHRDEEIMDDEDVMNVDSSGTDSPSGDVSRSPAVSIRKTSGNKNRGKRTIKVDFSSSTAGGNSAMLPSRLAKEAIAEDDDDDEDSESDSQSARGKMNDLEDEDEDVDENEKGDIFGGGGSLQRSSSARSSKNGQSRVRSTFFQSLDDYSAMINTSSLQDNVPIINSWSKLIHLVSLPGKELSSYGPELQDAWSTTAISCRDHHNWEVVVLEICQEYTADVDKFVFMKELRETLFNFRRKPTYFLIPCQEGSQNAVFSQRVRDFALQAGGKQIPIVYCNSSSSSSSVSSSINDGQTSVLSASANANAERKALKANLQETVKMVKNALSSVHTRKAILEMVDLTSMTGNAILYSVLLPSSLSSAATVFVSFAGNSSSIVGGYGGGASAASNASNVGATGPVSASWKEACPLVISSLWNVGFEKVPQDNLAFRSSIGPSHRQLGNNMGYAPPLAFSELSYAWLPRFFPPDITLKHVNQAAAVAAASKPNGSSSSNTNILKRIEESPSLPESVGILYEEMESALIWIMNSTRSILQTRITSEIQQQLRRMTKLEIRMTACIITIWQLCLYIRSRLCEEQGLPAEWSSCLNSLQLWQLSRLMLKVCEFVNSKVWYASINENLFGEGSDIKTSVMLVMLQENFQHGIRSIMECFSKMELNFYRENSGGGTEAEGGDDHDPDGEDDNLASASPVPPTTAPTSARRRNRQQQKQKQSVSGEKKGDDEEEKLFLVSQIQHLQISLQQKKSAPTAGGNGHSPSKSKGGKNTNATTNSSNSIAKLRAQKLLKKANRKLDDARLQYLEFLQRTDRFLYHNNSFFGNNNADTLSHRSSLLHPSIDSKKKAMIDKETSQRFYTFLSHYVAEVICGKQREWKQRLKLAHHGDDGDSISSNDTNSTGGDIFPNANNGKRRLTLDDVAKFALNARRHSNKMNITSIFSNQSLMANGHNGKSNGKDKDARNARSQYRKTISSNIDIMFGSLLPRDMMVCMIDWTFDKASGVQTTTGIDRKKVLKSILKLSEFIRQGKVTLIFPKEGEKGPSSGGIGKTNTHLRYTTTRK